ncbi:YicC/YloC family endoribonuclease [Oscillospiraceae bacterium MB08-C2-2]|nr:YicC/YloC family endoribonuclease [Oscillospiraceae bacterium MB08-C2-2]
MSAKASVIRLRRALFPVPEAVEKERFMNSMTGYGRAQLIKNGRELLVEVKSVNHRFFEYSPRIPRSYGYLEEKLKGLVRQSVSRGKVDVSVSISLVEGSGTDVEIDRELAGSYVSALRKVGEELGLRDDLSLSAVARFHDIFLIKKAPENEGEIWAAVEEAGLAALAAYNAMRALEGEKLGQDITQRLDTIEEYVAQVEQRSPQTLEEYRSRLYAKMAEVLADARVEESRILQEAAVFAEKIAVAEETVRLRSHLGQMREMLDSKEPIGRKLDFVVQEMNREANTIGSKAQDISVAKWVVEIKSEIEKIREQIQNIE